ncbi:MAG: hypothetical protein OXL34_16325 [Gemmatimonadota bacterium]|nr:hypothetical protein [Gemmatimonadota bacterium]
MTEGGTARASIAGALAFLGGCGDSASETGERGVAAGPAVVPVREILLEETYEAYLGNPYTLVVDTADGSFLVSDNFQGRIVRFGRDGGIVQRYGRAGEGPDEFKGMGPTFILNDSVVVGVDAQRRLFKLFSREDGEYLESFRYRGAIGGDASVVAGMVVAPSMEFEDDFTSVMIWDPGEGSFRYLVDLPEPYMQSLRGIGAFAGSMASGSVLGWPDTMLAGMAGVNELVLATWGGEVLDTIRPSSVRRRGVPENLQVKLETDMSLSFRDRVEMMSLLAGVYRMLNGQTVLIHFDQTVKGEIPNVEWLADIYLTVLSADRRTACVDGFVPYTNETRARLTVARDTLFLLDRLINETDDDLETWIRLYEIDTSGCDWLPAT